MRKTALILYKISIILGIIGAVMFGLCGIAIIVCTFVIAPDTIINTIKTAMIESGAPEQAAEMVAGMYYALLISCGVSMFICMAFDIVATVLTSKARKHVEENKYNRNIHILTIVFSVIGGLTLSVVGGVFALFNNRRLPRDAIEVKVEEK